MPTTFETFFAKHLEQRLRQRRLLVVHDPEERYREIVDGLADEVTTVLDGSGGLLEAREAALEKFAELGEDTSCKTRLVIYLPHAKTLEDSDRCSDPFAMLVVAGACFPDGDGDDYRQLCLKYLPEQAGKIEEMFSTGEPPGTGVINSLRSGAAESPVLRNLLKAEGPKDILVKFLSAGPATVKKLQETPHWVTDLKELVQKTLGLKIGGGRDSVETCQAQLWRHLLFSEFASDLPVALPASLASVPQAGKSHLPFVRSLCATLRDLGSAQTYYEEAANRVAEKELDLEAQCRGIEDFGSLDTFSFEERGFLRQFAAELSAGNLEEAREIVAGRQGSFWVERDPVRTAEWQVADLAARLLMELQALEPQMAAKRSLDGWIDFYTGHFSTLDTLHRSMEQVVAEISPTAAVLDGVLALAREAHRAACDRLARLMQDEAAKNGWPCPARARAVDICDRWVEPRWKAGERVAYFWIDALRYELAQTLETALGGQHTTRLETACASLPSVTTIGMASLLPSASTLLEVAVKDGKLAAVMSGRVVDGPGARLDVLAAHFGSTRTRLVSLEDLAAGRLPEDIGMVELLAVNTVDIDSLGENNPLYFTAMLPGILRKIQTAVSRLAEAGFTRAVITTDHGFAWMPTTSPGNAVNKPPGEWLMTKERALLGEGSDDSQSLVLDASAAGIRSSQLPHLAVPRGMATYIAGKTYFHGGLSPQECILPVLDVQLKTRAANLGGARAEVSLTYRGASQATVTSLMVMLELGYPIAELFGPASVTLLLQGLDKSGNVVAEAGTSQNVDPATREIHLERGKAIKVPIRLKEGFEGPFRVVALDPVTGTTHATVNLTTDFHR